MTKVFAPTPRGLLPTTYSPNHLSKLYCIVVTPNNGRKQLPHSRKKKYLKHKVWKKVQRSVSKVDSLCQLTYE
ncbi:unnamed protein product [Sphenostylis stenocarpa]|uniref:Uncharacterized protein n=1 Tax=Sphenostylis stenocarpa TaxID=92480 RepID=A0AA86S6B0_9FABA|nr:unnamed protein product [Sphenostylis stenocarpa]